MPFTLSRTRPFRNLQSSIGSATYRLNTILVGLQQVAGGADKTGDLSVSWVKPSPEKAGQVADQARIFACSAALTFVHESFDSFIRDIVEEEWLRFSQLTIDIAKKSVTKSGNEAYSLAERVEQIFQDLALSEPVNVAAIELFTKWRNMIVHDRNKEVRAISNVAEEVLLSSVNYFYTKYSHLDIGLALRNFSSKKKPVPKEATSLIALTQNVARRIDEAAINRVASTPADFEDAVLTLLGEHYKQAKGQHPTAAAAIAEAWQGNFRRREKSLVQALANIGVSEEQKKPVSAALPDDFVSRLAQLGVEEFATRIWAR